MSGGNKRNDSTRRSSERREKDVPEVIKELEDYGVDDERKDDRRSEKDRREDV